jgi:hypothetical protein
LEMPFFLVTLYKNRFPKAQKRVASAGDVKSFVRDLGWYLAENATLRKSLSHYGHRLLDAKELIGKAAEGALQRGYTPQRVWIVDEQKPEGSMYYRTGMDMGNPTYAAWAREYLHGIYGGEPKEETLGDYVEALLALMWLEEFGGSLELGDMTLLYEHMIEQLLEIQRAWAAEIVDNLSAAVEKPDAVQVRAPGKMFGLFKVLYCNTGQLCADEVDCGGCGCEAGRRPSRAHAGCGSFELGQQGSDLDPLGTGGGEKPSGIDAWRGVAGGGPGRWPVAAAWGGKGRSRIEGL